MKKRISTLPSDEWPDPWRTLVKKIDAKRDLLEEELARLRDEERRHRKIDVALALSFAIKELRDLTGWAHSPDPEPLPAGWLESTRKRLQGAIVPAIRAADRFRERNVGETLGEAWSLANELATALADRTVEQPDPTPATDPTPAIVDAIKDLEAKVNELAESVERDKGPGEQMDPVSIAITFMVTADREGRKVTMDELETVAGCDKSTLYRDPLFNATRKALRAKKRSNIGRGIKDSSGNIEMEWDPNDDEE